MKKLLLSLFVVIFCAVITPGQKVDVQEVVLDNGLRVLLVPRKAGASIAAGWIARVGSVNERPGITGLSHLFEHMMFKGTKTIGTNDIEANLRLIKEMDDVRAKIRREELSLQARERSGEIKNAKDPIYRSESHKQLLIEFESLTKREKEIMVKNELDRIYKNAGGSGMNAGTSNDYTIYYITLPPNKLELWFWLESDRLLNPVFREFYSERDVVYEERRLRTDSTPTGRYSEIFNSMFWQSSPYSWPVVGWPSDLEGITREEALDYYAVNYAPNNLTACIVGDFNPAEATELAKKYFGRLQRGSREPEPVRTRETPQLAEKRMIAYAETTPSISIRYHTVPINHNDDYALTVMASILNGRTGRLYKSLVLDKQISTGAGAYGNGLKYEGYFEFFGAAKAGHTPEETEQAIYEEIRKLQQAPVTDKELQKEKNKYLADSVRALQSNMGLMNQLLVRDAYDNWKTINTDLVKLQAVTADDISRVANTYFKPENRIVGVYYTKKKDADKEKEQAKN